MSQNHYTTKTKRRQKSSKRKDPSAATMAKLCESWLLRMRKKPPSKGRELR